jgi:predicted nucleic acid-binding Zn ribbon protein
VVSHVAQISGENAKLTSSVTLEDLENMLWPHIRDHTTIRKIIHHVEKYARQQKKQPAGTTAQPHTCRNCANRIPASQRYCSPRCFRIWYYRENPDLTPECRNCREPLPSTTALYCGDRCEKQARREARDHLNPWTGDPSEKKPRNPPIESGPPPDTDAT